ncbi:MAG: SurA N-terminal domain-containing protein [Patescibacteria group bacterium]
MYWRVIIFVFLAALLGGGFYFIITDSYPIIFVGSKYISANNFNKNYEAALNYYKNALEISKNDSFEVLNSGEAKIEIQRAVLNNLIEDELIAKALRKELKPEEIKMKVRQKIEEVLADKDLQKAAEKLYGFSLDDFILRVLEPQARRELLEGRLILKNVDFNEWFKTEKASVKIIILAPGFSWDGDSVIIKE